MKLVGAAFGSRFVSRLASISCYSGFASTGYVREAPRVATRLDRGRSWSLPAPGAQTWDQCIEGFSFWAGDVSVWQSFDVLQLAFGKTAWFCEFQLQACVPFVRQSMKLVGAAFGSRFVSRLASISCYSGFASTGYVREAPRVATRLDRGRSWPLPAPGAQTWDQCIEGFSFWAGDVRGGKSLEGRVRKPGLCKDRSARICYTVALCRAKRWHKGTLDAAQGAEGWISSCHCTRDWLAVKRSQGRSDEKAFRRHICTGIWHHWCGIAVQFVSPPGIARGGGWWAAAAEG